MTLRAERGSSVGHDACPPGMFDPHARQHSFVEIGHEIISDSRRAVVSY